MLECQSCKTTKPFEDFHKSSRKRGYQGECKECKKSRAATYYQANREKLVSQVLRNKSEVRDWFHDLKSELFCEACGESDPACLDFHHLGNKRDSVSNMVGSGYGRQTIKEEIAKCQVLCANCHRKHHFYAGLA